MAFGLLSIDFPAGTPIPHQKQIPSSLSLSERDHKYGNVFARRYMDELAIMEVPEPASVGAPGGLLMEQIPQVRSLGVLVHVLHVN